MDFFLKIDFENPNITIWKSKNPTFLRLDTCNSNNFKTFPSAMSIEKLVIEVELSRNTTWINQVI